MVSCLLIEENAFISRTNITIEESKAMEYRQVLETELYGLAPSKLAESIASQRQGEQLKPSSYRREISMTAPGIEDRIRLLSSSQPMSVEGQAAQKSGGSPEIMGTQPEQVEESGVRGEASNGEKDADLLSSSPVEDSKPSNGVDTSPLPPFPRPSSRQNFTNTTNTATATTTNTTSIAATTSAATVTGASTETATKSSCVDEVMVVSLDVQSPVISSDAAAAVAEAGNGTALPVGGLSAPCSLGDTTDQLKVLTAESQLKSGETSRSREVSPGQAERNEYDKLTMEAAALTREKWIQSEGM